MDSKALVSFISCGLGVFLIMFAVGTWGKTTVEWIVSQYAAQWHHFKEGIRSMPAGVPIAIVGGVLVWFSLLVKPSR